MNFKSIKIKFFVNMINFQKTSKKLIDFECYSKYNIIIINEKQIKKATKVSAEMDAHFPSWYYNSSS